ncbi:NADPH-dependent FMN reductase Lot6, putative [Paecilomyces variotii No. 5]|uniref:FMN reductase [NAD(P)H] n=1 Tax=Byssochlamys spectabilis (strain No. 5 / NBRC 109023) TaxID=1356009 RepID=V5G405_BYSSN|nr:NADPH-dependent FMN reductase Lot6, putative [Paecilomyces variotii No. 5]
MSVPTIPKIGLIVGSQRVPRACLQISEMVLKTIQDTNQSATISLIDLLEWDLPMYNEPGVPSQITSVDQYVHPHTRRWSKEIASYDAFIFVTPQYNWGYPAALKNAIDYLYNEWKGKPAMVVSYGGHGGGKAAAQLKQVLYGLRMRPIERAVELMFPDREYLVKAATGKSLGLLSDVEGQDKVWSEERKHIVESFEELLTSLSQPGDK